MSTHPPDVVDRVEGALLGYVLGSGFGVVAQGRRLTVAATPPRTTRGEATVAVSGAWPSHDEVRPGVRALTEAARFIEDPARQAPEPVTGPLPYAMAVVLGVSTCADPIEELVEQVRAHLGGTQAPSDVCGAVAAVATASSVLVAGGNWDEAFALALSGADGGAACGRYVPGPQLSARIGWAQALAARADGDPVEVIDLLVGAGQPPQETVPAAFALAAVHRGDPVGVAESARRLGGNSMTIAAIATALVGAAVPRRQWPGDLVAVAESVFDAAVVADSLAGRR